MTGEQVFFVAVAFVILIAITAAAQFKWLRQGLVNTILIFTAGVAVIASLRIAGLPPSWFAGSAAGFGLAGSLMLGAFVSRAGEERAFALPLLGGMGLALLLTNVLTVVTKAL